MPFFVPPIYDPLQYSFLCFCIIVLQCIILPNQSMTLYCTPFYVIAHTPIYDTLLYLVMPKKEKVHQMMKPLTNL